MMRKPYQTAGTCCFENNTPQLNPLAVKNTLAAGSVCDGCFDTPSGDCVLAVAYMPIQEYKAGYCPDEALCQGTLFPELLRPYC